MKRNFSFVNWITKKDIKNIINQLNLKLSDNHYDDYGKPVSPIRRYTGEDGVNHIIVFCENAKSTLEDSIIEKYLAQNLQIFDILNENYFYYPKVTVLNFTDFELNESFSLKDEEIYMDFYSKLNKTYEKYMNKKFGEFYQDSKKLYAKQLKKEIVKVKKNAEEDQENQF